MALFEIKNLTFAYNGAYKNALENVSLDIERGDFVLICGKSGCGKTTLLRLMKRELSPKGNKFGSIVFDGKNIDDLDDRTAAAAIGYVTQNPKWRKFAVFLVLRIYIRKKLANLAEDKSNL